jgi:hypothetical protein
LTASSSFYTQNEIFNNIFPLLGYHIFSFLNEKTELPPYCSLDSNIAEIIVRNNKDKPIFVNNSFKPGIYDINLNFLSEDYALDLNRNDSCFWINSCGKGRIVNPEIELVKIQSKLELCTQDGSIKNEILDFVKLVKSRLNIQNAQ